jgi:hypothetical protein
VCGSAPFPLCRSPLYYKSLHKFNRADYDQHSRHAISRELRCCDMRVRRVSLPAANAVGPPSLGSARGSAVMEEVHLEDEDEDDMEAEHEAEQRVGLLLGVALAWSGSGSGSGSRIGFGFGFGFGLTLALALALALTPLALALALTLSPAP